MTPGRIRIQFTRQSHVTSLSEQEKQDVCFLLNSALHDMKEHLVTSNGYVHVHQTSEINFSFKAYSNTGSVTEMMQAGITQIATALND